MALAFLRTIYVYKIIAYHTAIFITAAASGYACKSEIHIKCKGKGGKIKTVLIFLKFPNNNAIFVSRYNITPKNKNKMENKKSECSIKYTTRHVGEDTGKCITSSDDASHKKIHKTDGADSDRILCLAHDCSIRNKEQLEQSKICGCFSCCRIFPPSEITDYIPDEPPTAECPYCYVDSVIGDASGFPITKEFLRKMKKRWF